MRFDKLAGVALLSTFVTMVACGAPTVAESTSSSSSKETGSSDNDKTAFDFFLGKGLSATQAAAFVGNLDQESSMDPTISQSGGGPGRGIAQWSLTERWATENTFASQNGEDPMALQTQLDFIWQELSTNAAFGLADLQAATDLSSAVEIVQDKYEICGSCNAGSRLTFAQRALTAFSSDAPAATTTSAAAATPTGDDDTPATNAVDAGTAATDNGGTFDPSTGTFTPSTGTGTGAAASGDDDDAAGTGCVISDGEEGECMATSDCAASGGTSTAGFCSGSATVQCCTFAAAAGDDDGYYNAHSERRKK